MPPTRLLLAAMAVALLAPAAAHAATISHSGGVLTYTAAPGEENNLSLSVQAPGFCTVRSDPCFLVSEGSGVTITSATAGVCTARESASEVECDVPASAVVDLGDGNDTVFDWAGPSTVDGGTGDDGLDGNAGNDTLRGGAGADTLLGEAGDDLLEGGDGDDALEGFGVNSSDTENDTSGRDVYLGGGGTDLVDYTSRTDALSIDLDGVGDDGAPGEADTVGADIERIYGGSGDDTLTGNAAVNWLYGYGGDDILRGGAGDDILKGGNGADGLFGEDGGDGLEGEDGGDRLDGGLGVDAFDGDGGFSGADTILARDGTAETINCGAGTDSAIVDPSDMTLGFGDRSCERVDRGTVARTAPVLSALAARAASRGRLTIRFRLSERATVTIRLQRRVGRRHRTVPGQLRHRGRAGLNTVRFSGRLGGRRVPAGRYRLIVTARDAAGDQARVRRLTVRLRP